MNACDWLQVHTEEEIQKILPIAAKHQVPVTFRAAGTSLSGQALTDSVLLKLSHTGRNFRNYEIHVSPRSGPGMHGICSMHAGSPATTCTMLKAASSRIAPCT